MAAVRDFRLLEIMAIQATKAKPILVTKNVSFTA